MCEIFVYPKVSMLVRVGPEKIIMDSLGQLRHLRRIALGFCAIMEGMS